MRLSKSWPPNQMQTSPAGRDLISTSEVHGLLACQDLPDLIVAFPLDDAVVAPSKDFQNPFSANSQIPNIPRHKDIDFLESSRGS
jgi:hypothetical protein